MATRLYSWGSGSSGQLGHGNLLDYSLPQVIEDFSFLTISTSGCYSSAISSTKELYIWGAENQQQSENSIHSNTEDFTPNKVSEFKDKTARLVCCGWWHRVVTLENNETFSWGDNTHNQLGLPLEELSNSSYISKPMLIPRLKGIFVTSIACGWKHTMISTKDGQVFSWGVGRQYQLGLGKNLLRVIEPTRIKKLENYFISQVFCGWQHSACYSKEGQLFTWGSNKHGQLGVGKEKSLLQSEFPLQVSIQIKRCSSGWHHMIVLTNFNTVFSWGKGSHGHGNQNSIHQPLEICFLRTKQIKSIGCGSEHSTAITEDGDLYTWGWGEHGNLGHGNLENALEPKRVDYFRQISVKVSSVYSGGASIFAFVNPVTDI